MIGINSVRCARLGVLGAACGAFIGKITHDVTVAFGIGWMLCGLTVLVSLEKKDSQ